MSGTSPHRSVPRERPIATDFREALRRLVVVSIPAISAVPVLGALLGGRGSVALRLGAAVCLAAFVLTACRISFNRGASKISIVTAVVAFCVCAASYAAVFRAQSESGPDVGAAGTRQEFSVGEPIAMGPDVRRLRVDGDTLWAVVAQGVASLDLASADRIADLTDLGTEIADVAARGGRMAFVHHGHVSIRDAVSGKALGRRHFSEVPGPLLLTKGTAWLGNATHSKINWMPLPGGSIRAIPVPAAPTALAAAARSVWATTADGWLVEIDHVRRHVRDAHRIAAGADLLVHAHGDLWIGYSDRRQLLRFDLARRRRQGPPITLKAGTVAVVALGRDLFSVSSAHDCLERIDIDRYRVASRLRLAPQPSGLVAHGNRLWVAHRQAGTVTPIRVDRRLRRR